MPTTRRVTGVVEPLLDILDQLLMELKLPPVGPTFSDSIYTKLLASLVRDLPEKRDARASLIEDYLEQNPTMKQWLVENLKNARKRENLKALLRLELSY